MATYKQSIKAPKAGWAHANDTQMQAVAAEALALKHCMQAEAIFNWAQKHKVSLFDNRVKLNEGFTLLMLVLNDSPLPE